MNNLARQEPVLLDVKRLAQPDDVTCGPACLVQVYGYYGFEKSLDDAIAETQRNPDGGTYVPYLGIAALRNGFGATVYPFSLRIFDPTWRHLDRDGLLKKLRARRDAVGSKKLQHWLEAYITYFELGGKVKFQEMGKKLLVDLLARGKPILTGLSATYLYQQKREYENEFDDVRGFPVGHFVVICGYFPRTDRFIVRDPSIDIPFSSTGRYSVPAERLTSAILLGDVTFDSVLLVLDRPARRPVARLKRKGKPRKLRSA